MSEPGPRWVGWVWKGKRWQRVCEAGTLGACSRLLGDKARQLGIRDKHTILTGGGVPTVVPQESHRIAQNAAEGIEAAGPRPSAAGKSKKRADTEPSKLKGEAMKANGTPVYARQHKRGLTLPQQSAIDLLASGKTDTETAELLGLSRVAVSKWRLYDPVFQAALNQRRAEVWGAGCDRLRALVPKSLDALADELDNRDNPDRLKAAVAVLKLAQLPSGAAEIGPTAAEDIVRGIVLRRRGRARGPLEDFAEDGKGLPPFDKHMRDTWSELEALAEEVETARESSDENEGR